MVKAPRRTETGGAAALLILAACAAPPPAIPDGDGRIRFTRTTAELERRDRPAERDDLRILRRAEELLHAESVWNRDDDRVCSDDERAGARSLFCALHQASLDVAATSPMTRGTTAARPGCTRRRWW